MARIAGINIPLNKRVEIGLTYVYGVGRSTSNEVLQQAGVDPDTYVKDLTEDEVRKIRERIDDLLVEGDLRREQLAEHQAPHGDRRVPGPAPPARPAGQRPEDEDERADPQGPEARLPAGGGKKKVRKH